MIVDAGILGLSWGWGLIVVAGIPGFDSCCRYFGVELGTWVKQRPAGAVLGRGTARSLVPSAVVFQYLVQLSLVLGKVLYSFTPTPPIQGPILSRLPTPRTTYKSLRDLWSTCFACLLFSV